MGTALIILLGVIGIGLALALNWIIWFILLPMQFRLLREQFRRIRDWKKSNWGTTSAQQLPSHVSAR